jgi:ABC-type polysaccharide/polyol phosphate export permease
VYPLNGFRLAIYYGLLPTPQSMAMAFGTGFVTLFVGYAFFRRYQETLVFYV